MEYDWPGNVRELANEVRRYVIMEKVELCSPWSAEVESGRFLPGQAFNEQISAFERRLIAGVLDDVNGNRTKASELLQVPLPTLYRKIQKYGL